MAYIAFTQAHLYGKQVSAKERDKSSIQCIERYDRHLYFGTKDAVIQHLILPSSFPEFGGNTVREAQARKLGSSSPVAQLRVVPVFNHLLVLWDHSVIALNMFSLEPIPTLKRIQHVSLFEVCDLSLTAQPACVEMVTSSSRRKVIRIHTVGVDRWEIIKEVPLSSEPVALAVDESCLCIAVTDKYLLCDIKTGSSLELFRHNHSKQHVVVSAVGRGEFLLNGPGSLGMFVTKAGICQRAPLQWPQEVLAAAVCFPYILALHPQVLSVHNMLDQQCKQTVSLSGAKGLLSTSDGVLVFTGSDIFSLCLVRLEEQIHALVGQKRVEEALLLLDGVQSHIPRDSCKELQKSVTCLAGFVHFNREAFSEAMGLFIKGELDPREIISLYPNMESCLCGPFQSQFDEVSEARDLHVLSQEDRNTFQHYVDFLGDFLSAVRGLERSQMCVKEVDSALLRLYTVTGDADKLQQLVTSPNMCCLEHCVPVLEQHNRFFALGSLYQSHGNDCDAIKTWMKIADSNHRDTSCPDVFGHIVWTLTQLRDSSAVWAFADWTLQRNQERGVQIFTKRSPDNQLVSQDVLALLEKYPVALCFYLEFLVHDLDSEEQSHHSCLALAYVAQALQEREGAGLKATREKLQRLLWGSAFYDINTVYEKVKTTPFHTEAAILLGRSGNHFQALQVLVHQERDPQAAEAYCYRVAEDRDVQFKESLLLSLLGIYLSSLDTSTAAVHLLNNNPQVFTAQNVLQLLPGSWSVQLVSQFLHGSIRTTLHQRRMVKLQKALVQAELLRHKVMWMQQASNTKFKMDMGQVCKVCQRELTEAAFALSLQGEMMHTNCSGCSPSQTHQ